MVSAAFGRRSLTVTTFDRAGTRAKPLGVVALALGAACALAVLGVRGDEALSAPMLGVEVHQGSAEIPLGIYDDVEGAACSLSGDGALWYRREPGLGQPLEAAFARCDGPATLRALPDPPLPQWSKPRPNAATQAIFVATSLQEAYSPEGMLALHSAASAEHVPVTWMIADWAWVVRARQTYNRFHIENGDDVATAVGVTQPEMQREPWYNPAIAVAGAGRERDVASIRASGFSGFWGITWNSHGTDGSADLGAPWGVYCADPRSYKHPDPDPGCPLLAFEWTARDLTRAFLSGEEAAFSTDPDDLRLRGGFTTAGAVRYVQSLVDAYAAAGESRPIVMVSQQESAEEADDGRTGDGAILRALYHQARADGMRVLTLAQAARAAKTFAAAPRAIAFPYIAGGRTFQTLRCDVSPATIDFHDDRVGLTFVAGRAMPVRAFVYRRAETSAFNLPVSALERTDYPRLIAVEHSPAGMVFRFRASAPAHFGIAIWSDPDAIGLAAQPNVVRAGRGGAVVVFDLPAGLSKVSVRCNKCDPARLPLAL